MKTWQRGTAAEKEGRARPPVAALRAVVAKSFSRRAQYWQRIGARMPRTWQFHITGEAGESWFATIDAAGGRVELGEHKAPSAVWRSDAQSFCRLMAGERDLAMLADGRVRLSGDLGALRELFVALGA